MLKMTTAITISFCLCCWFFLAQPHLVVLFDYLLWFSSIILQWRELEISFVANLLCHLDTNSVNFQYFFSRALFFSWIRIHSFPFVAAATAVWLPLVSNSPNWDLAYVHNMILSCRCTCSFSLSLLLCQFQPIIPFLLRHNLSLFFFPYCVWVWLVDCRVCRMNVPFELY